MTLPPVSGAVVAWALALQRGQTDLARAVRALTGVFDGAVHEGGHASPEDLFTGLAASSELRLVLPVPGDPDGAPALTLEELLETGEGVVAFRGGMAEVLIPPQRGERWWQSVRVASPESPVAAAQMSVARQMLLVAMREGTTALERLGVDRPDPELGTHLAALDDRLHDQRLPDGVSASARSLIHQACVVITAIEVANSSDGAAVTSAEAAARRAPLREVYRAARTALVAAYGHPGTVFR